MKLSQTFILFLSVSMTFLSITSNAQNTDVDKKEKKSIRKKLWGGYDSNAIEKNLIIKDAFVTEGEQLLSGVLVKILLNSAVLDSMQTNKHGGFETKLRFDYRYILEFSKTGFVTKRVEVDLQNIPAEDKKGGYDLGRFQMGMLRYTEGMSIEEYETPVARYFYDQTNRMVVLDRAYLKQRKQKLAEQTVQNEAIVASKQKESDEIQEEYNVLIRDADIEFEAKDYKLAKTYYEEALKLKPLAEYPKQQINIINGFLAQELGEDEKYNALIKQADEAFELKDYSAAKEMYLSAIKIRTTDAYPREQIKKIDEFIASSDKGSGDTKPNNYSLKNVTIDADRAEFCSALAKKYPQGLTEEKYMEGSKSITRRIIVDGDMGVEYKMVTHNWGGNYFFKNGKPISRFIWQKEAMQ